MYNLGTKAYQAYKNAATTTASPGQLVLMLYDGALRFLEQAKKGFEYEDPLEFNETINNNILKAQAIINELNLCLDIKNGGELAQHMRRIYLYCDDRLLYANIHKDINLLNDVIKRLEILRNAWAEMLSVRESNGALNSLGSAQ
jgi:flagellar protein FliS